MKNLLFLILVFLISTIAKSQFTCGLHDHQTPPAPSPIVGLQAGSCLTHNGYCHTPKGNLHIMFVYVVFNNEPFDANSSWWPENGIPTFAALNGAPNNLLDINPSSPTNINNLSTYYRTMSNNNFTLTGEVFKVSINKSFTGGILDYNAMQTDAFAQLQIQLQNRDLSAFDKRQNNCFWNYDNSQFKSNGTPAGGDGIIDYVAMTFRLPSNSGIAGGASTQIFNGNTITTTVNGVSITYSFNVGHRADYLMNEFTNKQYFTHEFAHNLYQSPQYMGANGGLTGLRYYANGGWGMMGYFQQIFTANAWEKWWLGWIDMNNKTITSNATVILKDFITENDAIRIKIPNSDQYLWLENHQLISPLDRKLFYNTESPPGSGIYAFISADEASDCADPNRFGVYDNNATNGFKVLSRKGNWDYTWTNLNNGIYNFQRAVDNPIGGTTDVRGIRYDFNNNNVIEVCTEWNNRNPCNNGPGPNGVKEDGAGISYVNGIETFSFSGSAADPFQLNDEISINGNQPALNYPKLVSSNTILDAYNLNGLSVRITNFNNSTKEFTIEITYNNYDLINSKRWTAAILNLPNLSNDINADLVVKPNVTLTIDRSGTSNTTQKTIDGFFAVPTNFQIFPNAKLVIESQGILSIINKSIISLFDNSVLEVKNGGKIVIESDGVLQVNQNSKIDVKGNGLIIIKDGGTLFFNQNGLLSLQDLESIIEIQDGGRIIIGNNATFNWTGNGHIVVNNNPNQLGKVNITASTNAQNARVDIAGTWVNGQGFTQKLIEVVSGSLSIDRSISNVSIARGQIHLGENAIVDVEPICYFDNITFDPIQTGNKHGGLWVYGQQNTPYINNCTFNNATTGVTVFPLVNGVGIKNNSPVSTHSKFTNSNFLNCDRAIFVDARGAEIANCYITGTYNHHGILLRGIQYSSFIDQSTSRYHQIGADLIGNYHTETSVKRSSIYNNSTAGIMNRSSKLTLGCDQIYNNASTTNAGYNIWLKAGTRMFAENSMAFGSTYNDLSNQNSASMYLENAFGFNIHNGYNNFNTQNNYGILGQMIPKSVSVSNNPFQWDASTVTNVSNNYWNSMGTSPVLLQDYSIAYNDGWTIYLKYLDDMNQSLGMPPNITGNCAIGIIGNDPPSPFLGKTMIDDANNIGFDQIYKNALYQRFNGAYADAYNNFKLIAVYNYDTANVLLGGDNIITSEFREWFDVVMLSYSEMMATLYDGFAAGVFDSSFVVSNINSQIQQEILNKFEATNETDTTVNYYFVKYQFDFDNCMLNRLVGNYNSAIAGLSQMQNGVHIDANSEMISYYK